MATYEDPDELIPCPYDKVHMVARKRMPLHIMKCRKNFSQSGFVTCHFNARHVVPKKELEEHLRHCKDRLIAEVDMLKQKELMEREKKGTVMRGNISVPQSTYVVPESTECWDDENCVVEICPRDGGLFSAFPSSERVEERPRVPRATVSNPPETRMPSRMAQGGSEVYNFSVQQRQQVQPQPRVVPMGRGRGRGRGRGALVSHAGYPSPGRPGSVPTQNQSPSAAQPNKEDPAKTERKLKKMLRQIQTLEQKRDEGEVLDPDQLAKVERKDDVLIKLEQITSLRQ